MRRKASSIPEEEYLCFLDNNERLAEMYGKNIQLFRKNKVNINYRYAMAETLAEVPFETVSMDFIFALPSQSFKDLRSDIDTAFQSGANHVAIYPFIDFSFTSSTVPPMDKREKRKLLDNITHYCLEKGYIRNSIWTFSGEAATSESTIKPFPPL